MISVLARLLFIVWPWPLTAGNASARTARLLNQANLAVTTVLARPDGCA
jgi:hypothetical protein